MSEQRQEGSEPSPIVVTRQEGVRFAARIGAHELILDQPVRGGGEDAGPSPIDLLGAALGSCIALYVHRFFATRGIADDELRVEVRQFSARNPNRVSRFDVLILVPSDLPDEYLPMIQSTARVCPAYNTLARAADVAIDVQAPVALEK